MNTEIIYQLKIFPLGEYQSIDMCHAPLQKYKFHFDYTSEM